MYTSQIDEDVSAPTVGYSHIASVASAWMSLVERYIIQCLVERSSGQGWGGAECIGHNKWISRISGRNAVTKMLDGSVTNILGATDCRVYAE